MAFDLNQRRAMHESVSFASFKKLRLTQAEPGGRGINNEREETHV
jgi:hypothetical protein